MEKKLLSYCPVCSDKLIATNLKCTRCNLDLSGKFEFSSFDYLSEEDLDFVLSFLKSEGSFKNIQEELGLSYLEVKNKIAKINKELGLKDEVVIYNNVKEVKVLEKDSLPTTLIKEKLNSCGGKTTIKLLQGEPCDIWFSEDGSGLESNKIPLPKQLTWEVFDNAVELTISKGGKVQKGNARNGKLGSDILPVDSLEGYIAYKVHGVQIGESAFGPGFVISAILDWAGICKNKRGYIEISPEFLKRN